MGRAMSIQSRQALRLIKFVSEMKKNHFPNASSFSELLKRIELMENVPCACSERTLARDIKVLEQACKIDDCTKNFANQLAARSPGSYHMAQGCEIFNYCYNNWRWSFF